MGSERSWRRRAAMMPGWAGEGGFSRAAKPGYLAVWAVRTRRDRGAVRRSGSVWPGVVAFFTLTSCGKSCIYLLVYVSRRQLGLCLAGPRGLLLNLLRQPEEEGEPRGPGDTWVPRYLGTWALRSN
jgi:hypothetical protein